MTRWWLLTPEGVRWRIRERGLLLGRRRNCDIVLLDRQASAVHLSILPTVEGLEATVLGRNPTHINGQPIQGRVLLSGGDALDVPGARYIVECEQPELWRQATWIVETLGGRFGLKQLPAVIGGGIDDDLRVPGWPPHALRLSSAQGDLAVEFGADGLHRQESQPEGAVVGVEHGDDFRFQETSIRLFLAFGEAETTVSGGSSSPPDEVHFRFLPNGGMVDLRWSTPSWSVSVQLPELRARLVAALLRPPPPYRMGDFIPDDVLIRSIWSSQASKGRTDLNLLLHRTRQLLLQAGVNPVGLLVRPPQGGSVCFRLASGARVLIE